MSATLTHENEQVVFKFYFPRNPDAERRLGIHVKHNDVEFTGTWDEGSESLAKVIGSFPQMLKMITEEQRIQKEISGMSEEIDKLLEDTE